MLEKKQIGMHDIIGMILVSADIKISADMYDRYISNPASLLFI